MKNANYNLVKLLLRKLDDAWRVERHYADDARGTCKDCEKMLKRILETDKRHVELLRKELAKHIKRKTFE